MYVVHGIYMNLWGQAVVGRIMVPRDAQGQFICKELR